MMAYGKDMPETPRGPRILHGIRRDPRTLADADPLDERKLSREGERGVIFRLILIRFSQ